MPTKAEYAANPEKFKSARRALYARDPEKERVARRESYAENSGREKAAQYRSTPEGRSASNLACKKSREKLRAKLDLLKTERGCYDCGIMGLPAACYDWDHLPGKEKLFNIGADQRSRSLVANIAEIEKCQCVCSNCHRIRSMTRKKGEVT